MTKKNILFVNGIPDNRKVIVHGIDKNGVYNWRSHGNANLSGFLQNDLFHRSSVLLDVTGEQELPRIMISAVFNQITDADTHQITLKKAGDFYKSISDKVPFFNSPLNIMKTTRDNISELLQGIDKLYVPKTVKIQPKSPLDIYDAIKKEELKFPVIFRQAGDHGGVSTIKIDSEGEQFSAFALDGRDYYLTQFVDYKENGIYAKYRLVVVDGKVYIRHIIFSDQWIIHSDSRKYMEKNKKYQRQEENLLKAFNNKIKPNIQQVIDEIYRRLELDYFGIDCAIDKHFNMILFEANANMSILTNRQGKEKNIWDGKIELIKNAIISMISERLNI